MSPAIIVSSRLVPFVVNSTLTASYLRRLDHMQHAVGGRLSESSEHDGFQKRKLAELGCEPVKEIALHVAGGIFPAISNAHAASQVAACRRFDTRQAVDVWTRPNPGAVGNNFRLCPRRQAEFFDQKGRNRQKTVLVDLNAITRVDLFNSIFP